MASPGPSHEKVNFAVEVLQIPPGKHLNLGCHGLLKQPLVFAEAVMEKPCSQLRCILLSYYKETQALGAVWKLQR